MEKEEAAVRAHLVQMDVAWEAKERNYARAGALIERAAPREGDLVVLPEMFDTGFSFNLETTADEDGATLGFLRETSRSFRVTLHGSRTVVGGDGRGRNMATVTDAAGELVCEYAKIHPFSYGRESERFSGGDEVKVYAAGGGGRGEPQVIVCPAVCYDLRFPELFRIGLLKGAEVFALGANWPAPRKMHRRALSLARAIENQAYMLCVNRAGRDPFLEYAGGSVVFGPRGETVGELDERESVLTVELDIAGLRSWRDEFPAWRDGRLLGPLRPLAGDEKALG